MTKNERSYFLAGQARSLSLLIKNKTRRLASLDNGISSSEINDPNFMAPIITNIEKCGCEFWAHEYRQKIYLLYIYGIEDRAAIKTLKKALSLYRDGQINKDKYKKRLGDLYGYPSITETTP